MRRKAACPVVTQLVTELSVQSPSKADPSAAVDPGRRFPAGASRGCGGRSGPLSFEALSLPFFVLGARSEPRRPVCTHAWARSHALPNAESAAVHPEQAFQAGLGTCPSMINLPVTITRASQRLASPGQVDLVSKPGSV